MYRAYFVTCPGKKTRKVAKGETRELCQKNLEKSNFWQYIIYLLDQGITDFSEYIFITGSNGKVVFSTKKEEVTV